MATKVVNLKDFSKELGEFTKASLEMQRAAVTRGVARSIPDLVAASPVDTGRYASSWSFTETETSAILGNTAPHSAMIEYGSRPFTPPIRPLLEWAKRVLQDPSQPPNYSSEVWALAKGTQKKIAKYGMEPKAILENAIPKIIENIRLEFEGMKSP
jgi:hypothetical protein